MLAKVKSPLSRRAMLVSVNVSMWTARKLDRKITKETIDRYNAKSDAVRTNKLLIEKSRMEKLTALVSEARALFYHYTKPWMAEGTGILPNENFMEFEEKWRDIERRFDIEADAFARGFAKFIEERKVALNGLFNSADYPDPKEIRSKFRMERKIMPLPDVKDFRADLDPDVAADIRREIEIQMTSVTSDAMKHTARQVVEAVGHMATKLGEYKSDPNKRTFFADSLVDNIRDLAKLLPAFNFTDDPKLTAITDRIVKELCVEDADTLRKNDDARKVVAKSAEEIVKEVEHLFG